MMTMGSSMLRARPIVSPLSAIPGPEVVVNDRLPPKAAPRAAPAPAISSSAWKVRRAEVFLTAEFVEDVRRRSDRIAAEEDGQATEFPGGDDAPGGCGVAGDVGVVPGFLGGRLHHVLVGEHLGGLAVGVARLQRRQVGRYDLGRVGELRFDPVDRGLERPGVHPADQSESEEVLRSLGVALLDVETSTSPPR